jgi:hypothetical protein
MVAADTRLYLSDILSLGVQETQETQEAQEIQGVQEVQVYQEGLQERINNCTLRCIKVITGS